MQFSNPVVLLKMARAAVCARKHRDQMEYCVFQMQSLKSKAPLPVQLSLEFQDTNELGTQCQSKHVGSSAVKAVAVLHLEPPAKPAISCVEHHLNEPKSILRLSVLRGQNPIFTASCAGHMKMSGRFSDICAELDRIENMQGHVSA